MRDRTIPRARRTRATPFGRPCEAGGTRPPDASNAVPLCSRDDICESRQNRSLPKNPPCTLRGNRLVTGVRGLCVSCAERLGARTPPSSIFIGSKDILVLAARQECPAAQTGTGVSPPPAKRRPVLALRAAVSPDKSIKRGCAHPRARRARATSFGPGARHVGAVCMLLAMTLSVCPP